MHVGESIVPTAVTGNAKGVRNRFLKNRVFGSFMRFRFGFQIANHTLQSSTCSPEIKVNSRVLLGTRIKWLTAAGNLYPDMEGLTFSPDDNTFVQKSAQGIRWAVRVLFGFRTQSLVIRSSCQPGHRHET